MYNIANQLKVCNRLYLVVHDHLKIDQRQKILPSIFKSETENSTKTSLDQRQKILPNIFRTCNEILTKVKMENPVKKWPQPQINYFVLKGLILKI